MALTLGNCAKCGRVYNTRDGSQICATCFLEHEADRTLIESAIEMRNARTVSELSANTRLPRARVQKILREAPVLARGLDPDGTCSQCGMRRALAGAGRCVGCQLALYKSLGDVAADITYAPRTRATEDRGRIHILAAMQEKRRRTGSYRFLPPPQSIKGTVG